MFGASTLHTRRGPSEVFHCLSRSVEQGKTYPWTDRVILDRAGDSWVIADIEYVRGGSLVDSIQNELDEIAKYLVKKP